MIDEMDHLYLKKLFSLPTRLVDKTDRYYLLHWSGEHILLEFIRTGYFLHHQDTFYQPVFWDDTTIKTLSPTDQYQVSFRRASGLEHGIALIRKLK